MSTAILRTDTADELTELALLADRHGLQGLLPGLLDRVADRARRAGVTPVLVDILVDVDAAEVVRLRALGRIHRQLVVDRRPPVALVA